MVFFFYFFFIMCERNATLIHQHEILRYKEASNFQKLNSCVGGHGWRRILDKGQKEIARQSDLVDFFPSIKSKKKPKSSGKFARLIDVTGSKKKKEEEDNDLIIKA